MPAYWDLTNRIIGLAIEVHRTIGLGLLESVYAACLCNKLAQARFSNLAYLRHRPRLTVENNRLTGYMLPRQGGCYG
jgi:GxxExxY protein